MKNGKIVSASGNIRYYLNDQLHRKDSPAIELTEGDKYWFFHDKLHGEDGPAIEYQNGRKLWYFHGQNIKVKSNKEFLQLVKLKGFW
jgi:hypothetical protein